MASPNPINLLSVDGEVFSVDPEVAKMSTVLRDMAAICGEAEEEVDEPPIPLNVTSDILKIVITWCESNYQQGVVTTTDEKAEARQLEKKWGQVLHSITRAANYLDIEGLLNICLDAMACQIKGKNSLEIREFFGLAESGGGKEDLFCVDSVHLRQIVPEELWIIFTNKLLKSGSGDLENLANSSSYFRNLLLSKRTAFLFEKVFSLVASSILKKRALKGLPVSKVLQLRTVCSNWNSAIDKLVHDEFQYFGHENLLSYKAIRTSCAFKKIITNCFQSSYDELGLSVDPFLRHFKSTHPANQPKGRNPFIWGNVEAYINMKYDASFRITEDEYKQEQKSITKLLSKYGKYVHEFHVELGAENNAQLPKILRAWLLRVPNLKQLEITGGDDDDHEKWDIDWVGNYKWKFPKLKHLDKLAFDEVPAPIFNKMIRQYSQVSTLRIMKPDDDFKFFTFPLPNLKNLQLLYFKAKHMDKLRSSVVQWPLESLKIIFSIEDDFGVAALLTVIQEKFAKTMTNLVLYMSKLSVGKDCKTYRLELPKLKKFHLDCRFIEQEVGLDFLLPMVNNLEEIKVDFEKETTVEGEDIANGLPIVQFVGFEENMLDSNVWEIFKKLKKVTVIFWEPNRGRRTKVYCRKDWL